MKLLIADDEETIRNGMGHYLQSHCPFIDKLYLAANGGEALDCIMLHKPDIVLLDIKMPQMSGIEVLREARRAGVYPKTIILSGYDDFQYAQQAIRYGVVNYLLKPCSSTELCDVVSRLAQELGATVATAPPSEHYNHLVEKAMEYIRENYANDIGLSDVATHVGVTPSHLSRLFSQFSTESFNAALNRIRVESACGYLTQLQMKVYEVAYRVGFRDEKYFSRVFKQQKGVTPAEYRGAQRGNTQ